MYEDYSPKIHSSKIRRLVYAAVYFAEPDTNHHGPEFHEALKWQIDKNVGISPTRSNAYQTACGLWQSQSLPTDEINALMAQQADNVSA